MNTTATEQKFYLVETNYVDNQDNDKIEIRTAPARTNFSHEIRINGFCGATNNRAVYAHGEFATLESARAAIALLFEVRDEDESDEDENEEIIETYFLKGEDDDEDGNDDDEEDLNQGND